MNYRGRIAPSPTGYLHLGHARTFWIAQERARQNGGTLIFRNEDLDAARCKAEFVSAMFEDLRWFGLQWQEGRIVRGVLGPTPKASAASFTSRPLKRCGQAVFFTPAPVRARMSSGRCKRPTRVTMNPSIPEPAAETPQLRTRKPRSIGVSGFRRSEEHTSELQSRGLTSYAVFCLKKKT